jgi:hypothetical protein
MTDVSQRQRWKHVELELARMLGGERVPVTGRARGNVPDIRHQWLSIEVKSWTRIPVLVLKALAQAIACTFRTGEEHKLPIAIIHQRGHTLRSAIVVMSLGDFMDWFVSEAPKEQT